MKLISYIICILLLILILVLYCHISSLKKINNNIEILQTINPSIDKIQDLLQEKSPTVFKNVLYEWEPIINIFDKSITEINNMSINDKTFYNDLIDCFNSYSLCGSMGWDYYFTEKNILDTEEYFTLETQHRHIICQIMGTQRYYLASPNQTQFIKKENMKDNEINNVQLSATEKKLIKKNPTKSIVNFWNEEETGKEPFNKVEYMEIILREGNCLYIPYGWWFLSEVEEDSMVLEGFNISCISLFV